MADAVVVFVGVAVIAGAGYVFAARWTGRPRPVEQIDGVWRMPPPRTGDAMTETSYYRTILEAAHWGGWRAVHFRPARTAKGWRTPLMGDAGFPDWVLCHDQAGIHYIEVKADGRKLEPEQVEWRDALTRAGGKWRLVSVPSEADTFCTELANIRNLYR